MSENQDNSALGHLSDQARKSADEFPGLLHASSLLVVLALYRTSSVLDHDQSTELAAFDLDPRQFNTLAVLHRVEKPISMLSLAKLVVVKPNNLTGIVESLYKRGYISRQTNPQDRRSFLVSVSPEGERFLRDFLPAHWEHLEKIMSGLNEKDRENLIGLLRKLVVSVENNTDNVT